MDLKKFTWKHTAIVFVILIVVLVLVAGASSTASNADDEKVIDIVTFGGYAEDNYWKTAPLILYDKAGGRAAGAKEVARVSGPLGEQVDIYEIQEIDSTVFYKIGIKGKTGWTTKYIVTGEE